MNITEDQQATETVERDMSGGTNVPPEPGDRQADDRNLSPETAPEGVATADAPEDEQAEPKGSDDPHDDDEQTDDEAAETFPREYVEKLRKEAADARVKAKRADDLAVRLHTALVAATGRLADPSDLPFDESHLEDADALNAAVDALVAVKPHLASRRPFGAIGQGVTPTPAGVDLAGILRAGAR